jgi:hypothetical protein
LPLVSGARLAASAVLERFSTQGNHGMRGECALCIDKSWNRPQSGPHALVAELVDALVSGTSGESRGGSSPLLGTIFKLKIQYYQ